MVSCCRFQLRSQVPDFRVQFYPVEMLLQDMERWKKESDHSHKYRVSWVSEQLETFRRYVSLAEVAPLISSGIYEKLNQDQAWEDGHIPRFRYAKLVTRIFEELGYLFKVPMLEQLSHSHIDTALRKDQLVAGFINFLLHLLQDHLLFSAERNHLDVFMKQLRILITIIGDRPFRAMAHEEEQGILEEFELVVNEAGAFVHSLVFCSRTVEEMSKSFAAILEHIQLFKTNITKFLHMLPNPVFTPRSNSSMDSPFILVYLIHALEDLIDSDDNTLVEVKKQSKKLHQLLLPCQSFFTGIEIDELKNQPVAVQIISMAYDAKYLVSAFLDGDIPPSYLIIRLTHLIDHIELDATRLQDMKQDCNLMSSKLTDDFHAQLSLQTKKDPLADDITVGFEQHEEHILDLLIRGTKELQEVFIYGIPGVGKTTLATRIYHHPSLNHYFDRRSWCVVSQMHNRENLLIGIWNSITNDSEKREMKNKIQEEEQDWELKIYQILKCRRYLMVMDDLWDPDVRDKLRFLPNDENGSRILFTSRNKDLAPCGGNGIPHELPVLSNDQCWKLLEKKVFHNSPCPPQLLEVGKRIAAKCYGLPLVVGVVAGILSTVDMDGRTWENMIQGLNRYMAFDKSNQIMQILEISYKHLPLHLKICFLYFRASPEDEKIYVRKLLQLWIAEGFICKGGENKSAECVAKEYLAELVDKNLVIVVERGSDGGAKVCVIHDLLHELCLKIAEKDDFLKLRDSDHLGYKENNRWLYTCKDIYGKSLYRTSPNHLESSSSVCERWMSSFSFDRTELRARVAVSDIDLRYYFAEDEVLYASRYLDLKKMPGSLHKFVNLEFLMVTGKVYISPQILEMVKLKCICAGRVYFWNNCDMSSRTSKIEYLSRFQISSPKDMKMLACLPILHKLKCKNERWREKNGSWGCLDLQVLTQLECLKLYFHRMYDIKFPCNVRKLTLYVEEIYPRMMTILGALPCLHVLKLEGERGSDREGKWDTSDGEFKQLRILKLRRLNLGQWNVSSSEHFPKLKQLYLNSCRWLIEIPGEIGEIETLQFIEVYGEFQKSLVDSAIRIEEQQEDVGNEQFRLDMQKILIWPEYKREEFRSRTSVRRFRGRKSRPGFRSKWRGILY